MSFGDDTLDPNNHLDENQIFLRRLVDVVWGHCHEDQSVPATYVADMLIEKARKQNA